LYVLRRICGITRWDRRRNVDIKHDLGVTVDIVQRLQRRRLTYFGHVARMDNNRYPNILLHGYGSGQRARGRPKKKWVDNIKEDCTDIGISINEAMKLAGDRNTWRSTVLYLSCQRAKTSSSSPISHYWLPLPILYKKLSCCYDSRLHSLRHIGKLSNQFRLQVDEQSDSTGTAYERTQTQSTQT